MKLTRRQEDFIHKMLDLYRELQGPIHYTVMAERLGVSRFTAYDMLRLLEEKGLVISEYQLAESKSGPGRSEVVFIPSPEAHRLFASLAGETAGEGWEAIKTRALEKVRAGELYDQELIKEVLARTPPEGPGPLRYCVEVMTIAALRLRSSAGRRLLLEYLPGILPGIESATLANLSLLGGFALGLLANESADTTEWGRDLLEHIRRYQTLVADMDPKVRRQLAAALSKVFSLLMIDTPPVKG